MYNLNCELDLEQLAFSLETSKEVIEAIYSLEDPIKKRYMMDIWEDPSKEEKLAIWKRLTKNGLINSTDFVWGASGEYWANNK